MNTNITCEQTCRTSVYSAFYRKTPVNRQYLFIFDRKGKESGFTPPAGQNWDSRTPRCFWQFPATLFFSPDEVPRESQEDFQCVLNKLMGGIFYRLENYSARSLGQTIITAQTHITHHFRAASSLSNLDIDGVLIGCLRNTCKNHLKWKYESHF